MLHLSASSVSGQCCFSLSPCGRNSRVNRAKSMREHRGIPCMLRLKSPPQSGVGLHVRLELQLRLSRKTKQVLSPSKGIYRPCTEYVAIDALRKGGGLCQRTARSPQSRRCDGHLAKPDMAAGLCGECLEIRSMGRIRKRKRKKWYGHGQIREPCVVRLHSQQCVRSALSCRAC